MKRAIFASVVMVCTGCRTAPPTSFYDDIKFGMSPAEVRALVPDHYATVVGEHQAGDYRVMFVVMSGREMAGNRLHTIIRLIFYRDKMLALGIEYFLLVHHPEAKLDREQCSAIFSIAVGDVASVYGQPDHREGDPVDNRVVWKWFPDGRFIAVMQMFAKDRCGAVEAVEFDGSEADFKKFSSAPDFSGVPMPAL